MSKMNKTTNISWANKTWNVIAGCKKVSPACKLCYAELYVSDNEAKKGVAKFKDLATIATNGKPVWNGNINVARERLFNEPKRWF